MSLLPPDRVEASLSLGAHHPQSAASAALSDILEDLLRTLESASPSEMLASILLLDDAGERLVLGAAPNLPPSYNIAIDGLPIGPNAGSCGTAAHFGRPVYISDTQNDPLWEGFRELAREHSLRACWSTPIIGLDGGVLGTFAIYHRVPKSPTPTEIQSVNIFARAAASAIQASRNSGGANHKE